MPTKNGKSKKGRRKKERLRAWKVARNVNPIAAYVFTAGVTVQELADHIGVFRQQVDQWKRGERQITQLVARKLAEVTEMPEAYWMSKKGVRVHVLPEGRR